MVKQNFLPNLYKQASALQKTIVLSEGEDKRIIQAAMAASQQNLAKLILLGEEAKIEPMLGQASNIRIIDPKTSHFQNEFSDYYYQKRRHRSVDKEQAQKAVTDPYIFACIMVALGYADGTLGGAACATATIVRHAIQMIGAAKHESKGDNIEGQKDLISSFFLMLFEREHHARKGAFIFADCGLNIEPSPAELAKIAIQSASSYRQLTRDEPLIAFLSFSSKGSAKHEKVDKMVEATKLAQALEPNLYIDGELQFDAALLPEIASSKAKDSKVAGKANLFIFPDLNSGNIGYKIAERIGGAIALGPILQGLAKPANDLSRGCSADDVLSMIAITALQANDSWD